MVAAKRGLFGNDMPATVTHVLPIDERRVYNNGFSVQPSSIKKNHDFENGFKSGMSSLDNVGIQGSHSSQMSQNFNPNNQATRQNNNITHHRQRRYYQNDPDL